MAASKYDFSIEQGSSFRLSIIYKDDANNVIDLTNYCARLIWKDNCGNTTTFETGNNDSVYKFTIDGPNGQILLLIDAATTNDYSFATAKYDLELQSPTDLYANGSSEILKILYGTVTLVKRYSQSTTKLNC